MLPICSRPCAGIGEHPVHDTVCRYIRDSGHGCTVSMHSSASGWSRVQQSRWGRCLKFVERVALALGDRAVSCFRCSRRGGWLRLHLLEACTQCPCALYEPRARRCEGMGLTQSRARVGAAPQKGCSSSSIASSASPSSSGCAFVSQCGRGVPRAVGHVALSFR